LSAKGTTFYRNTYQSDPPLTLPKLKGGGASLEQHKKLSVFLKKLSFLRRFFLWFVRNSEVMKVKSNVRNKISYL
jgi:hypothetical protein